MCCCPGQQLLKSMHKAMSLIKCSILTTNLKLSIKNQSETLTPLVGKTLKSTKLFFRVSNCSHPSHPRAIISLNNFPLHVYLEP